jgi:hypothetical protein
MGKAGRKPLMRRRLPTPAEELPSADFLRENVIWRAGYLDNIRQMPDDLARALVQPRLLSRGVRAQLDAEISRMKGEIRAAREAAVNAAMANMA